MRRAFEARKETKGPVMIDLPWPISSGIARRSRQARDWRASAGLALERQRPLKIDGPYAATFWMHDGAKKGGVMISGFWKPVSDLLVSHGVVRDEGLERQITMRWSSHVEGCRVLLEEAEEPFRVPPGQDEDGPLSNLNNFFNTPTLERKDIYG